MTEDKLRRRIAVEAAGLLIRQQETDLAKARLRAARQLCHGYVRKEHFPSEAEIRDEIERRSYVREGDARFDNLQAVRIAALRFMRRMQDFEPRIAGTALDGGVRSIAAAEVLIPGDFQSAAIQRIQELLASHEEKLPGAEELCCIEVEFCDCENEGASLEEFEALLRHEYPDLNLDPESPRHIPERPDRFAVYRMLLAPLAQVQQRKSTHPEGDALYHSLQVFELARDQLPYDEEFLLAALLHDVGKGIDPADHVRATLDALSGQITERTAWLIEHLHAAQRILENSLGERARRRLQQHPDYDELMLLARCDRAGRVSGGKAPSLDEALEEIRHLVRTYG